MSEVSRQQSVARSQSIAAAARPTRTRQQQRPETGGPGSSGRVAVIVRSVDLDKTIKDDTGADVANPEYGQITVQRVQYSDNPPVIGNIETNGPEFFAWPLEGSDPGGYDVGTYPANEDEPDEEGKPVPIAFPPINEDFVYCRMAERRGGIWIVEHAFTLKTGIASLSVTATVSAASSV